MGEIMKSNIQILIGRIEIDRHAIASWHLFSVVIALLLERLTAVTRGTDVDEGQIHMIADRVDKSGQFGVGRTKDALNATLMDQGTD